VAGAAGRLGEALLSEVVSSPRYRGVTVLTGGRLASTVSGLEGVSLADLQATASHDDAAPELDVFVCWGDVNDPLGRSHNRRDAIYAEVSDAAALRAIAAAACRLGARRLLLLAPLLAWQQVSAAGRMLPEAMEMELARLPIPTIVIVRPTTELQRAAPAGASRMQRFARFYLSQLRFMLPAVTHSLRSTDIARAALSIMADANRPGLAVASLDDIRRHAGVPSGRPEGKAGDNTGDKAGRAGDKPPNPGDRPGDSPGEKLFGPEDKAADKSSDNSEHNSEVEPADKRAGEPADKRAGKLAETLADRSSNQSGDNTRNNFGDGSARA